MVNKSKKGNYTRRSSRKTKTLGGEKGEKFLDKVNKVVNDFGELRLPEVGLYETSNKYNDKVIEAEVDYNKGIKKILQNMKDVGQTDKCGITGTFGTLKNTECEAKKYKGYLILKIISEELKKPSEELNRMATRRYNAEVKKLQPIIDILFRIEKKKEQLQKRKPFEKEKLIGLLKYREQMKIDYNKQETIVKSFEKLKNDSENLKTEFEGLKDHYEKKVEEKKRHIEPGKAMMIDGRVADIEEEIKKTMMGNASRKKMNEDTIELQRNVSNTDLDTIREGEEEEEEETGGRKTKRRRRNKRKTRRVKKH